MVRLTDSMIKKLSEPGLWFLRSDRQMNDFSCLLYELAVKMGVPVTVLSQNKKQIQNAVIAKVRQDFIKTLGLNKTASKDEILAKWQEYKKENRL